MSKISKERKPKGPMPGTKPGIGITDRQLGKEIKKLLAEKNMSVDEFARRMDEAVPYILEILKGRRSIQFETLLKISKVLNVPMLEFSKYIKDDKL